MTKAVSDSRKLYIWSNQMLYLGVNPAPYRDHAVVSDKLIVSIEGAMEITLDSGEKVTTRSCLLGAGINFEKPQINTDNAVMAIYFLTPITQDYPALKSIMTQARNGIHYSHPEEDQLINDLLEIRNNSTDPQQAAAILRRSIIQPHLEGKIFKEFDDRIVNVTQRIKQTVSENISVKQFADEVYLSESRLEKLFKDQVGIPITKYRLKFRVFIGIIHLALGHSITDAAMAAGFSSSSHFSKSFSAINGIPPSSTFLKPPYLRVLLADELLEKVNLSSQTTLETHETTPKRIQLGEYNEYLLTTQI